MASPWVSAASRSSPVENEHFKQVLGILHKQVVGDIDAAFAQILHKLPELSVGNSGAKQVDNQATAMLNTHETKKFKPPTIICCQIY